MRSPRLLAAAVVVGAAAVTAACGQQHAGSPAASASDPPSAPGAGLAGCHGTARAPAGRTLTLGNSDDGKSFCLPRGGTVLLILRGTPGRMWTPVHASSAALAPRANGRLMLVRGATGASFLAVHPGIAVLSSMRPVCRIPASAGARPSSPASMPCAAELAFRVTIVVAGK